MSGPSLSSDAQLRYMLQWFEEWSELQRQDFMPILAEKLAGAGVYMNGVVNSMGIMNCQNKPMNLFQCRMKLFNEWYPTWSEEEQNRLIKGVSDIDEDFGKKLTEELSGESKVNGDSNVTEEVSVDAQHFENGENATGNESVNDNVTEANGEESEVIVQDSPLAENSMPLEIAATS